ncbi:hypothetical protein [Nonomuraea sp. NPDC002799]
MAGAGGKGCRPKIWLGLLAIAFGSIVAWHTSHDGTSAITNWAAVAWPWLLLTLAVTNFLRSAIKIGSLIGPGLLASTAGGGLAAGAGADHSTLAIVVFSVLSILTGTVLLRSSGKTSEAGWTRGMITGCVKAAEAVGNRTPHPRLTLRALAGEIRADFGSSRLEGPLTVRVTAIAGHVHLTVPRNWPVVVMSTGTVLTRITDTGNLNDIDVDGAYSLRLHLLGLCGAVSLVRI